MNSTVPAFDTESVILQNLQYNEDFSRKVLPFIDKELFTSTANKQYFQVLDNFYTNFNQPPTVEAISVEIENLKVPEDQFEQIKSLYKKLTETPYKHPSAEWLLKLTEDWCQDRKLFIAFFQAHAIYSGGDKNATKNAIPDILSKALSFSFDTNIGHDYLEDAKKRFQYFHKKVSKIPFGLSELNEITNGGVQRKTLSAFIAQTNGGKSIMMCNLAAQYIAQGFHVLYITLEMAEEELAKRIDANLLNINIDDLHIITEKDWDEKIEKLKLGMAGKLIIKEYPTSSAHIGHFKVLIKELEQKQKFKPDVIIVDYLNICSSAKVKNKQDMYSYNKSIAEELRSLAQETNTALWTCLQFNRSGVNNTDVDITNVSESHGITATLDFLVGMIVTEELMQMGQVLLKQLKSRFGDVAKKNTLMIGLDRNKMRFYDLNMSGTSLTATQPKKQSQPNPAASKAQKQFSSKFTTQPSTTNKPTGIKV